MQQNILSENESKVEELVALVVEEKWKYACKRQVPVNGKIPDIVAYNSNSDTLIAVEIKLKNWKRGLYQAFLNKNIADFSFLCMPKNFYKEIRDKIYDDLKKTGLGFLEIDSHNQEILIKKIPEKNVIRDERREKLKKIVCGNGGEYE